MTIPTLVSSKTDTLQNLQNIQVTVDTWSDGIRTIRSAVQGIQGGAALPVGGNTFTITAELTRPANATAYAQYDIIAHEASGVSVIFLVFDTTKVNSSGYIVKARLETDRTAEAAGYILYLYRVAAASLPTVLTNLGDNDIFPLKYANRSSRIGSIPFAAGNWITAGTNSDSATNLVTPNTSGGNLPLKYGLAAADSNIYGLLINAAAQTPQSAQNFSVSLSFESNS